MARISIPSCGLALLQAPQSTFDYVLHLTEGEAPNAPKARVLTHRCVLLAHSETMRDLINDTTFFDLTINLQPGYLGACIELLQFMYVKDPDLLSDVDKVLHLCGTFHMPFVHLVIRERLYEPLDEWEHPHIQLRLKDGQTAFVCGEFFNKCLAFHQTALAEKWVEWSQKQKSVRNVETQTEDVLMQPEPAIKEEECKEEEPASPKPPTRRSKGRVKQKTVVVRYHTRTWEAPSAAAKRRRRS